MDNPHADAMAAFAELMYRADDDPRSNADHGPWTVDLIRGGKVYVICAEVGDDVFGVELDAQAAEGGLLHDIAVEILTGQVAAE